MCDCLIGAVSSYVPFGLKGAWVEGSVRYGLEEAVDSVAQLRILVWPTASSGAASDSPGRSREPEIMLVTLRGATGEQKAGAFAVNVVNTPLTVTHDAGSAWAAKAEKVFSQCGRRLMVFNRDRSKNNRPWFTIYACAPHHPGHFEADCREGYQAMCTLHTKIAEVPVPDSDGASDLGRIKCEHSVGLDRVLIYTRDLDVSTVCTESPAFVARPIDFAEKGSHVTCKRTHPVHIRYAVVSSSPHPQL